MKKSRIKLSLFVILMMCFLDTALAQYYIIQFESESDEYSSDVVHSNDGNYIGLTIENGNGQDRLHLFKFTIDGTVIWNRYFQYQNLETVPFYLLPSIIKLSDGNYTILYTNENPDPQTEEPFSLLIKVDDDGREIWRKEYECCFYDQLIRPNGEIWLGGDIKTLPSGKDLRIKRVNTNGTQVSDWDYFYSGGFNAPEQLYQISTNTADEIILSGVRNLGNSEMIHLRIATDGTQLSELEFGNRDNSNYEQNVISTPDGGSMYITTYVREEYYLISKIDENGELVWSKEINSGVDVRRYQDMILWNGVAVAVGTIVYGGQVGPSDALITVIDMDGNVTNDMQIDLEANAERILSVIPDTDQSLLFFGWIGVPEVTGGSNLNPFIFSVKEFSRGTTVTTNLLWKDKVTISPNPTKSHSMLEIDQDVFQTGKLKVFDTNGKLVNESIITERKHLVELSNLLPAVYILQLFNDLKMVWTGKIVKL